MERIMITITTEMLADVDSAAERLRQNRSQFIRNAIADFLHGSNQKEFDALMAEGYQETSTENSEIVSESLSLQASAVKGSWEWESE